MAVRKRSTQLVLSETKSAALLQRARAYATQSRAEKTIYVYKSLWNDFVEFCRGMPEDPLPAPPALVIQYITHLAEAQKVSTIETKLAAIGFRHRHGGMPDPTKDENVKLVLDGIKREHGAPPERKAGVEREVLGALLKAQPDSLRGARNRALLLIGYACDLRRSEIVALQKEDVRFLGDRMVVTLRKSKTDQTREGFTINVPRMEESALCPVHALATWLEVAKIKSGPLFRKVDRWDHLSETALTDQVVATIIKDAAGAAGYARDDFSGHSLRRGLITQAARNREQTGDIRKVSRHKTEIMVDAYRADAEETQMRVIGNALRK